jgi:hypothetical protein
MIEETSIKRLRILVAVPTHQQHVLIQLHLQRLHDVVTVSSFREAQEALEQADATEEYFDLLLTVFMVPETLRGKSTCFPFSTALEVFGHQPNVHTIVLTTNAGFPTLASTIMQSAGTQLAAPKIKLLCIPAQSHTRFFGSDVCRDTVLSQSLALVIIVGIEWKTLIGELEEAGGHSLQ